jgi:hypothetical protein
MHDSPQGGMGDKMRLMLLGVIAAMSVNVASAQDAQSVKTLKIQRSSPETTALANARSTGLAIPTVWEKVVAI